MLIYIRYFVQNYPLIIIMITLVIIISFLPELGPRIAIATSDT
jgi:hypothetical protein